MNIVLAIGFGNLAMLGWLAAVAVPLLIHLWSRQKHRETSWAAMTFLRNALQKSAKRIWVQNWLLIALRTLAVLFAVLAVSELFWERGNSFVSSNASTHHVLVFDQSYSMGFQQNSLTLLEEAKQLAKTIVANTKQGDHVTLVSMDSSPRVLLSAPAFELNSIQRAIDQLSVSYSTAKLGDTMQLVHQILEKEESSKTTTATTKVTFFTDLAQNTWSSIADKRVEKFEPSVAFQAIALGPFQSDNIAVTKVRMIEPLRLINKTIPIEATISNFGATSKTRVQLLIDGNEIDSQSVNILPGGQATVLFQHRFEQPGIHSLEVRIAGDSLPADNRRWLMLDVRRAVRALLVEGTPQAGKFIDRALNSSQSTSALFETTSIPASRLRDTSFQDFDFVFLCNCPQITTRDAARFEQAMQTGVRAYPRGDLGVSSGQRIRNTQTVFRRAINLIVTLGDQVIPNRYNELTRSVKNETVPFLPFRIGQIVQRESIQIDPLDYAHPIAAPFQDQERAGLLTTPIHRYYQLRPPLKNLLQPPIGGAQRPIKLEQSNDFGTYSKTRLPVEFPEVALAFDNGDPFIVTTRRGLGTLSMVAVPLGFSANQATATTGEKEPWSLLPAWPSFLPLVREMVNYSLNQGEESASPLVGQPISGFVSSDNIYSSLQITRPDGQQSTIPIDRQSQTPGWSFAETTLPGIYQISSPKQSSNDSPKLVSEFAVNVDPAESDLTKLPINQLPSWLSTSQTATPKQGTHLALQQKRPFHYGLLISAAVLLFAESFFACWFGRKGSASIA